MAPSTPQPPDAGDDKTQAAGTRAMAEVSEALNGLRELAERVTPAKSKTPAADEDDEQLALSLARGEAEEAEASHLSMDLPGEEPLDAPGPVAILIPPSPEMEPKVDIVASPIKKEEAAARKPRVGETLREAREGAGFSLEDVADEIKIKEIYLQAIEEGRYGDLPSRTYAVGFVRSYAQALGLHTEELVARCRAEVGTVQKIASPPPLVMREPEADRRLPGGALITVCVVLALVVYAASYAFLRSGANPGFETPTNETSVEAAPASEPAPVPAPVTAAPAPQPAPVAKAPEITPSPVPVEAAKTDAPKTDDVKPSPEASHGDEAAAPVSDAQAANTSEEPTQEKKADEASSSRPVVVPGASAEDVKTMPPGELKAAEASAENPSPKAEEVKPVDLNTVVTKPAKTKAPSRIKLHAAEDTSVKITDSSGKVLAERMIKKGESFYVPDHKHYTLATTNAGALRLSVDGRDMPALGDEGEAMHNIPLDAGDLLQVLSQ